MNETIKQQLDHRTIRFFQDKAVEDDKVKLLLDVAGRTATSNNLQMASIIRVTDPELKSELADNGKQAYIKDAPELWVFIADAYRNLSLYEEITADKEAFVGSNYLIQAITDAVLMAQNVNNALESLGLGGVFLGSILNDPARLIKSLKLPKYTMPILGLAFGYPNDNPQLKPRIPIELRLSENEYETYESYQEALKEYDEEMTHYYDTRDINRRSDSFSLQIKNRYSQPAMLRDEYLKLAKEQGFDINLD